MAELPHLLEANRRYTYTFTAGNLPVVPRRRLAILACMDARMDLFEMIGLAPGDAHVIRNAGGRASDDAIRSIAISQQLLGTREIVVVHHTDCGMITFTNEQFRQKLRERLDVDASDVDFLPFTDLAGSVREDIARLRESPLLMKDVPISGLIYDVRTGRLEQVE